MNSNIDIPMKIMEMGIPKISFETEGLNNRLFNINRSTHPCIGFFHLAFKAAPIFTYMFMGVLVSSTIQIFIATLIAACVDFWFVKNISGRYMLGMRWWNGDDEFNREGWVFDSYDNQDCATEFDRFIFWFCLRVSLIFWLVILITKALSFSLFWGILVVIVFCLNVTNYYGYSMCYKEQTKKIETLANLYGKISKTFQSSADAFQNKS